MSRKSSQIEMVAVLGRVASIIGSSAKGDILKTLGFKSPGNYSNWIGRGTIPWAELFAFSQNENISMEWLLTGKDDPAEKNKTQATDEDHAQAINDSNEINKLLRSQINDKDATIATLTRLLESRESEIKLKEELWEHEKALVEQRLELFEKEFDEKDAAERKQKKDSAGAPEVRRVVD
jgi:Bacteriophage CI repressor helix-turn-helix domain